MEKTIEIVPTNAKKFSAAIMGISEAAGLIQTSGVDFKETFPVIQKLMGVLEELSNIQSRFNVVPSGRGRGTGKVEEIAGLTAEEVTRLELEVGVALSAPPVQALAPQVTLETLGIEVPTLPPLAVKDPA